MSKTGIETDLKKIAAVKLWPRPETVTQVLKFLGFTNYYRKFLYRYAHIARPLNKLISGNNAKKKRTKIIRDDACEEAFQKLKELCSNTPCLAYPDYKREFNLYTDISESGLGVVLVQKKDDGIEHPIAYTSRTLSKSDSMNIFMGEVSKYIRITIH